MRVRQSKYLGVMLLGAAVAVVGMVFKLRNADSREPPALLSLALARRAIHAEKEMNRFWRRVDKRADRTAHQVRELQRERFASGVGTRFQSESALRDLRSVRGWGVDGADLRAAVLADHTMGTVKQHAFHHRKAEQANKAQTEELADSSTGRSSQRMSSKRVIEQANHGLLGSSLTGLVRNIFGGPRSTVAKYSAKHRARAGTYHLTALGESHFDAHGDPIVPKHERRDHGLASAGVKVTNSLNDLYTDSPAEKKFQQKLAGWGEKRMASEVEQLVYGQPAQGRADSSLRARRQKIEALKKFGRELSDHRMDNEMLVSNKHNFFADKAKARARGADSVSSELAPLFESDAAPVRADASRIAKALKDNEMLVSGDKGFFQDASSDASSEALHEDSSSRQRKGAEGAEGKLLDAASRGLQDVAAMVMSGSARRSVSRSSTASASVAASAASSPQEEREDERAGAMLEQGEGEHAHQRRARRGRGGEARKEQAVADVGRERSAFKDSQSREGARQVMIRGEEREREGGRAGGRMAKGGRARVIETHLSAGAERGAVAGYFASLEARDKKKHTAATRAIAEEEQPHIRPSNRADRSDRRDTRRDNAFFDKMARKDRCL